MSMAVTPTPDHQSRRLLPVRWVGLESAEGRYKGDGSIADIHKRPFHLNLSDPRETLP